MQVLVQGFELSASTADTLVELVDARAAAFVDNVVPVMARIMRRHRIARRRRRLDAAEVSAAGLL